MITGILIGLGIAGAGIGGVLFLFKRARDNYTRSYGAKDE